MGTGLGTHTRAYVHVNRLVTMQVKSIAKVKDQLVIASCGREARIQVRLKNGIWSKTATEVISECKTFMTGAGPSVTCALNVPMLCPRNLLILATPLTGMKCEIE